MRSHLRANKKVTDGAMATMLDGLICCYKHCNMTATQLMVASSHNPYRTFGYNSAGVVCNKHADESRRDGCRNVTGG